MMLAALTPAATPAPPAPIEIRDIAPPLDVFPYPLWMVIVAGVAVALILALLIWLLARWLKSRPGPPPLSAETVAMRELESLRTRINELPPYEFSIAVSDVLRTYIGDAKFQLPATRQTSPEFLLAISKSDKFSDADRALLAEFLERSDLIKFARIDATAEDSARLLESAGAFVRGGRA